jgi:hypothetical protein
MASGCNDDCSELWMCGFIVAEVTWMVLWKSGGEELWTCGCIAAAGSGLYGGLETWMQQVGDVWICCGGRGVASGLENGVQQVGDVWTHCGESTGMDGGLETWMQ